MRKRRINRRKQKVRQKKIIITVIVLICTLAISYAAFSTVLNINVTGNIKIDDECVEGKVWEFEQEDNGQEFRVPCSGEYKVELWGAGGSAHTNNIIGPGNGGYTSGKINLKIKTKYYIYVGNNDNLNDESYYHYNGGGSGEASGGGSTDIRISNGNWNDFVSLKSRIMVASGGGGGFYRLNTLNHKPGHGGGLIGYDADAEYSYDVLKSPLLEKGYSGHGGRQTMGGNGGIAVCSSYRWTCNYDNINGKFGMGGYGIIDNDSHDSGGDSSGGGSGYYGGGHGIHPGSTWSGGGGGSSFISGHNGCDAISEQSTENSIIHTGQSVHYSGLHFTDTVMIDGAGYQWTDHKLDNLGVVGMPTHDGTGTMTGNEGDGFAKITLITRKPN